MKVKKDFYEILGVTKESTEDEIKKKYRKVMMSKPYSYFTQNKNIKNNDLLMKQYNNTQSKIKITQINIYFF